MVPCCNKCNKRERLPNKTYCDWIQHLKIVCESRGENHLFKQRKQKILDNFKKHKYPNLNTNEKHAIRVISNSLYKNIKIESDKSLELYKQLDEAFVK